MSTSLNKKKQLRLQAYVFNLLFLGVIGLLAWFSTQYSSSSDWTYGQRNSLTSATIRLLDNMPDDIHINVYLSDPSPTRAAIETLLKRYQENKKNFYFKILNPDLDIDLAKAENISRYGQVTVKYQQRKETLDTLNESLLGNALSRLSREQQALAVFITGHGEHNPFDTDNNGYSKLANALQEKGFDIQAINLLNSAIPETTSIVVLAGAVKNYLDGEIEQLKSYLQNGGNLLWLQDPDSTPLTALQDTLPLQFEKGILVDADPQLRATLRIQHPATIAVLQYNLHDITEQIPYNTLFMLAGSVEFIDDDKSDWSGTTLFSSRQSTWAETGTLLTREIQFNKDQGDRLGPLAMAQALERSVDNNGKTRQQRIVAVADSDFLSNSYIGAGANLLLGQNMFNWLSHDEQLLSFEIKSAPDLRLELSDLEVTLIGLSFLVALPVALLVSGLIIWRRRKRA